MEKPSGFISPPCRGSLMKHDEEQPVLLDGHKLQILHGCWFKLDSKGSERLRTSLEERSILVDNTRLVAPAVTHVVTTEFTGWHKHSFLPHHHQASSLVTWGNEVQMNMAMSQRFHRRTRQCGSTPGHFLGAFCFAWLYNSIIHLCLILLGLSATR